MPVIIAVFAGKPRDPRAPSQMDPRTYEYSQQLTVDKLDEALMVTQSFIPLKWAKAMNVSLSGALEFLYDGCVIAESRQRCGYPTDLPYEWVDRDDLDEREKWRDPLHLFVPSVSNTAEPKASRKRAPKPSKYIRGSGVSIHAVDEHPS